MNECLCESFLLNGEIKDRNEFDSRFLYQGKAFYEVLRIIDGIYIFCEEHIDRLKNSLKIYNIDYCIEIKTIINHLLKYKLNNDVNYGNVRLVMKFNSTGICEPDILVYFVAHRYPDANNYKYGVETSILSAERKTPNAKFINHDVLAVVSKELSAGKVYETLLSDNKGFITEGSKSNVFFIKDNVLYTPPENRVLPGVTRKYIYIICNELNINIIEKDISINSLKEYNTVFITGTSVKVLPVRRINDISYNVNNNALCRITDMYEKKIRDYIINKKQITNR